MNEIVITGRILNFNALDRQGEIIYSDCEFILEESVPLRHEFGDNPESWLGVADLEKRDDGIWAKMHLRVEDEQLLPIIKQLKPCIGGTTFDKQSIEIFGSEGDVRHKAYLNILKKVKISSIGICQTNVDYGIQTLEEMENDTRVEGTNKKIDV